MTELDILRQADKIVRARLSYPMTDREREVLRDTLTGLLWVRTDLVIEEAADLHLRVSARHAASCPKAKS